MSELIDREATVKQICKIGEMLGMCHDRDVVISIALFVQDDKTAFPTIERPQWIPCSERLPKRNELVIASLATGIQLCEYVEDRTSDEWFSLTDNCYVLNRLVKAWMPLPKPYQKEGEQE